MNDKPLKKPSMPDKERYPMQTVGQLKEFLKDVPNDFKLYSDSYENFLDPLTVSMERVHHLPRDVQWNGDYRIVSTNNPQGQEAVLFHRIKWPINL
jgi:hypothetical protein